MNIIETLESLREFQDLKTHKQRKFLLEYLSSPARNAKKAYINAGYNPKCVNVTAYQLLANPSIKSIVEKMDEISVEECKLTEEDVTKFWSDVLKNDKYNTSDRIRVSELVAKYRKMFDDNNLKQPIFQIFTNQDFQSLGLNGMVNSKVENSQSSQVIDIKGDK